MEDDLRFMLVYVPEAEYLDIYDICLLACKRNYEAAEQLRLDFVGYECLDE